MNLNEHLWHCFLGNHDVRGGARYADKNGKHSCEYHIPYLDKK